jgi:hypothetical protein
MVRSSAAKASQQTLLRMALGSVGILALGIVIGASGAAQGTPLVADRAASSPPSSDGALAAVAAVPQSSDVWVVGSIAASPDGERYFEARRHHGHWQRIKPPNIGGRFGSLNAIAAGSSHSVWVAGEKVLHQTKQIPVIFRLAGQKFVPATLPKLKHTDEGGVSALSASSASNAWAVGTINSAATGKLITLHWNGKKWSAEPLPADADDEGLLSVSTSGANNAWALSPEGEMFHWDGKAWTNAGSAPARVQLDAIATASSTSGSAVGYKLLSHSRTRPVVMRFNGTTWSMATLAGAARNAELFAVAMHGTSAWAIGMRTTSQGAELPLFAHSTGGAWKEQRAPGRTVSVSAVAAKSAKRAYIVGSHYNTSGEVKTFVDVYNGHSWKPAASSF